MGAELVSVVLARWTHVSDRAFRVLVRMALTALDKPSKGRPAAVYLGGRELLAMSLRSEKGTDRTRHRAVARALAELSEAGAVRHLRSGWAGQKAVYRLTLDGARTIDEPNRMGGPTSHPVGGLKDHPMDGPSGTEWMVPETTPRNQEEVQEERAEEKGVGVSTTSHPPRASRTGEARVISLTDRRQRIRDEGRAEIAAKAAGVRDRLAAKEAARRSEALAGGDP